MIKIHFSRPQRGASGAAPLAVRRIGRVLFMALQKVREATSGASRSLWHKASLEPFRACKDSRNKSHGHVFVGRAALAAFSAAGCAFEGQGMARIGGPPATSESVIILPAGSGDASQSRRPRLPRRKASRTMDLVTWGVLKLHPAVFRHHGKPCAEGWPCRGAPCLSFTSISENPKRVIDAAFRVHRRAR